jgi:prolyl-tRNA editing enzyme YbaK/EbsC (Cys-tRNA(Pro) deacylase)
MSAPLSSLDLQAFITAHAIPGEILHMGAPTPTVEAAAQALGVRTEQIVKSILFLVQAGLKPALPEQAPSGADAVRPYGSVSGGAGVLMGADGSPNHVLPVLAIACGTAYLERRAIAAHFGVGRKRVKLASPGEVLAISGYEVGAMPPFGHRQPLRTLLDCRVLTLPEVYAGGGDENAMLRLDPHAIARFAAAEVLDLITLPGQEME